MQEISKKTAGLVPLRPVNYLSDGGLAAAYVTQEEELDYWVF